MQEQITIHPPKSGEPVIISEDPDYQALRRAWLQVLRNHYKSCDYDLKEAKISIREWLNSRPQFMEMFQVVWLEDSLDAGFGRLSNDRRRYTARLVKKGKYEHTKEQRESESKTGTDFGEKTNESDSEAADWAPPENGAAGMRAAKPNRAPIFRDLKLPHVNVDYGSATMLDLKTSRSRSISAAKSQEVNASWMDHVIEKMEEKGAKDTDKVEEVLTEKEATKLYKMYGI